MNTAALKKIVMSSFSSVQFSYNGLNAVTSIISLDIIEYILY